MCINNNNNKHMTGTAQCAKNVESCFEEFLSAEDGMSLNL